MRSVSKHLRGGVIIAVACLFAAGGFFLFARTTRAEEPCLRGGDGSCVYLTENDTATPPPTGGEARFMLGGANSHNVAQLSDGTLFAAVARYSSKNFFNIAYTIELWRSIDGGISWKRLVADAGKVNEIREGSYACKIGDTECINDYADGNPGLGVVGSRNGAGFLGFSLAVSEQNGVRLYLANAMSCRHNLGGYDFNKQLGSPSCGTSLSGFHDSNTFLSMYEYNGITLTKKGLTRAIGHGPDDSDVATGTSSGTYPLVYFSCLSNGGCHGAGYGIDHPSVSVGVMDVNGIEDVFINFNSYRGDTCHFLKFPTAFTYDSCPSQINESMFFFNDRPTSDFIHRRIRVTVSDFTLESDVSMITLVKRKKFKRLDTDNVQEVNKNCGEPITCEFNIDSTVADSGTGEEVFDEFDERHAWYSTTTPSILEYPNGSGTLISRPIVFYGYSRNDGTGANRENHKLSFFSWIESGASGGGTVQDQDVNWTSGDIATTDFRAAITIGESGSPDVQRDAVTIRSAVSASSNSTRLFLAGYTDPTTTDSKYTTAVPYKILLVNILFPFSQPGDGFFIADPASRIINPNPANPSDPNFEQLAFVNAGGPTVGVSESDSYVAFPAVSREIFQANPANALKATDIYYQTNESLPHTAIRMTPNNATLVDGFLNPVLPQVIANNGDQSFTTSLTNIFTPPVFFSRVQDVGQSCSGTNACRIAYAGNWNTHGVRGWAWASTVGWISLSCENLGTCYQKNEPFSTQDGGSYYGVRVVANSNLNKKPLVGQAWSERIGFISFDRADSISSNPHTQNPCGRPPSNFGFTDGQCKLLPNPITDSAATITLADVTGFPTGTNYALIDNEIIKYTSVSGAPTNTLNGVSRGYGYLSATSPRYFSPPREHAAGSQVIWLSNGATDPTTSSSSVDILRGISNFDPTTYEVSGWARALSWKEYQEQTVCQGGIGGANPPPCDKEWGWIKLAGTWNSVNRGNLVQGCGENYVMLDTTDGYPDSGELYFDFFPDIEPNFWEYFTVDRTAKKFMLNPSTFLAPSSVECLNQQTGGSTKVPWVTQPSAPIPADGTFRDIPLNSVNGLNATGKIEVTEGATREIMDYSEIDVGTNTLLDVTRAVDGTALSAFTTNAKVIQLNESGFYRTYALPMGSYLAEKTLVGYAWSAPNTDTPFPGDPTVSRYQENIAGFGWISFQPNQLKLVYPFLRTLFGDIYSGGTIDLIGPDPDLVPAQYSSTYLLQTNNAITPLYTGAPLPSAGAYERCLIENQALPPEEISAKCDPLNPGASVPDLSIDASIPDKAQFYNDLATIVEDCTYKINDVATPDPLCTQGRSLSSTGSLSSLHTNYGLNKFGHRVILCRANPNLPLSGTYGDPLVWQMNAMSVFKDNLFNPEECAFDFSSDPLPNPKFKQVTNSVEPTIYILPDDYEADPNGFKFFTFNIPLQFNNADVGKSGSVTFMIPGSVIFDDAQMRYCPDGVPNLPCTLGDSPTIDSIRRLASVGWIIRGSVANDATGRFLSSPYYPEAKMYRMGAVLVLGDNDQWGRYSTDGTYSSIITAGGFQLNVYGLIIAPAFQLNASFYTLDSEQRISNPSENIVYDGRALANPPPGFADITTGLPLIRRVTP